MRLITSAQYACRMQICNYSTLLWSATLTHSAHPQPYYKRICKPLCFTFARSNTEYARARRKTWSPILQYHWMQSIHEKTCLVSLNSVQNHDESMMKNIDEHSNVLPRQFLQSIDSIILYDPSDIFQTGSKRLCWQQWKPFPRSQGTCMLFIFEILKMFEAYRVALWRCDFAVAANTEQSCSNMKFWQ